MIKVWYFIVAYFVVGLMGYCLKLAFAIFGVAALLAVDPNASSAATTAVVDLATIVSFVLALYVGWRAYKYLVHQRELKLEKNRTIDKENSSKLATRSALIFWGIPFAVIVVVAIFYTFALSL